MPAPDLALTPRAKTKINAMTTKMVSIHEMATRPLTMLQRDHETSPQVVLAVKAVKEATPLRVGHRVSVSSRFESLVVQAGEPVCDGEHSHEEQDECDGERHEMRKDAECNVTRCDGDADEEIQRDQHGPDGRDEQDTNAVAVRNVRVADRVVVPDKRARDLVWRREEKKKVITSGLLKCKTADI